MTRWAPLAQGIGRGAFLIGACWACALAACALAPTEWQGNGGCVLLFLVTAVGVFALVAAIDAPEDRSGSGPSSHPGHWLSALPGAFKANAFLRPELWVLLVLLPLVTWAAPRSEWNWRLPLLLGVFVSMLKRRGSVTSHQAWPLVTLALSLGICLSYLACGAELLGSTNNDAAYYYGVARHIAETGRFEEPIVWHHLVRPANVTHPPFDYWPALPSLWLVPVFKIFGSEPRVLGLAASSVSCVSVLLFWYLISVQRPVRSAWLQVTGLLLFSFSPPLWNYRFDAETVPWTHVWIIASLIALSRRNHMAVVLCAFGIFLARPDCVALTAVVWGFGLLGAAESRKAPLFLSLCAGMLGIYVSYHLFIFGELTPPGSQLAPRVLDGMELYRYRPEGALLGPVGARIDALYFETRAHVAIEALRKAKFVPLFHLWFLVALAGGARAHWQGDRGAQAAWLMLPLGALVPSLLSPAVFAEWRTLHTLLPILLLVGCHGFDSVLQQLLRLGSKGPALHTLLPGLGAFLVCGFSLIMICDLRPHVKPPGLPVQFHGPTALASHLDGDVVMSLFPWFVLSTTRSPAVGLPANGADAVLAAISHYKVRWLMLPSNGTCQHETTAFCKDLVRNAGATLGSYQFSRVATGADRQLFLVEETSAPKM